MGSRENEITVQAYTLSVVTPPRVHSAFLPVQAMSQGTRQEAKRRQILSGWAIPIGTKPAPLQWAEHGARIYQRQTENTPEERYELNEQFSYSPDAKDATGIAANGGHLVDNFLFIPIAVFASGDKLHPMDHRTLREVLYLLK